MVCPLQLLVSSGLLLLLSVAFVSHHRVFVSSMDQNIATKWHTTAGQMAAELEKYMGSPYTINVVEEIARNKMITMVHEKREEDRKRLFEETAQVSLGGVDDCGSSSCTYSRSGQSIGPFALLYR